MEYEEAMKQKCDCGKETIGGWIGFKPEGRPNFSRVSGSRTLVGGIVLTEEHTLNVCYSPHKIPSKRR